MPTVWAAPAMFGDALFLSEHGKAELHLKVKDGKDQ